MQTFLPYPDFKKSAQCLDNKRLGKQRVEVLQLLQTFLPDYNKKGWLNHPARLMWKNNLPSLLFYGLTICEEWIKRGFKDTCVEKMKNIFYKIYPYIGSFTLGLFMHQKPNWLTKEFCASHRSNLLRKNPDWYGQFGWTESNDLPYIWPKI